MIITGAFSIMNNKTIIHNITEINQTTTPQATQYDISILTYFLPLYNYYLWYNEPLDNKNYRWVKESVMWRSLYLIIISIWPRGWIVILGAFLIVARAIMLIGGLDFFSLETKNKMNKRFYHNIEEFIAYPLCLFTNSIKRIFQKKSTLATEADSWKQTYAQVDPISHIRTIVQYLIATAAI